MLGLGGAPACAREPADLSARVQALLPAPGGDHPGCALALTQGRTLRHAQGYGLADLNHRVPITPDTVFDLASASKTFTAVAVLLLQQDGKLSLSDTLQQHLPEQLGPLPRPITLRHLLQHTDGLPNYIDLLLARHTEESVTGAAEALQALRGVSDTTFLPGSRWAYGDSGFFLAAQVVERVSGQSLDALLQKRVFGPLGMKSTHVRTDHRQVLPHRAIGYRIKGRGFEIWMSQWNQAGDGAVQSTANDLARWLAELADPQVLDPALVRLLAEPGVLSDGSPFAYGLGLAVEPVGGRTRWQHEGAWVGYRSLFRLDPKTGSGIAVLCNWAEADPAALADRVMEGLQPISFPRPGRVE